MKGEEFSDLAALWSAPAPAAEQGELERLALRTPRRARMVQAAELGLAIIIALCVAAAMVWRLGPATLLIGSAFLLLLGWSAWQRHRLADAALLVDGRNRSLFVDDLIVAKQAELRRSAIGLALILPAALLTAVLSYLVQTGGGSISFADFIPEVMLTRRGFVALALLGGAISLLTLSHMRLIGELARLRVLARDYADEGAWEERAGA